MLRHIQTAGSAICKSSIEIRADMREGNPACQMGEMFHKAGVTAKGVAQACSPDTDVRIDDQKVQEDKS